MTNKIQDSFLMICFHEFINEIFKFRELILFNENDASIEDIQKTLIRFVFYKKDLALQQGTLIEAGYREISYIMTVFADEIFINLNWNDQEKWKNKNLETQIFGTHIGGKKIFENIDEFLISNANYKYDIGSAYLFCLGLGFRGRYRGINDHEIISQYKEKLFSMTNNEELSMIDQNFILFPQTQKHTVVKISSSQMSSYKLWLMVLGAVVLAYISLSYILWNYTTNHVLSLVKLAQYDIGSIKNG